MKTRLAVFPVIMAVLLLVMTTGCADATTDSQYVGTWMVSSAERDGEALNSDELSDLGIIITMTTGGAATVKIDDQEMTATWEKTRNGVDLTFSGGAVWKLNGLAPTLHLILAEQDHQIDVTFRKR